MKRLNLWLLAALLGGMIMSVASCKDDDKEPSAEEQEQQAVAEQESDNTAFAVLDYLANLSNAPADFLSGTYEPTVGTADDGDAGTRIVNTNTMELAAERFADLAEADIDENTTSYTWSDDRLGTMTYRKSQDGKSWATVDVSIRQMPHLQKIIYRSPEQAGDNSQFKGTAYYRFGDIVSKKNDDGKTEYWICVRPCFGPEGKENSHWVTVSPLPSKNVWTYRGSNNIAYALPTQLGDNAEHAQNFAELLFAICFPEEWENNIINNPYESIIYKGVPMFNDFSKSKLKYHRKYFWQRVQDAWTIRRPLFYELFGGNGGLRDMQTILKSDDGLNLLTNGFSWSTKFSNSPTLYRYRFVNGEDYESNMHKRLTGGLFKGYSSVKAEVISSKTKLNVNDNYVSGWVVPEFFGTVNPHFIIRYAKGCELASDGAEDPKQQLTGVTDVYRYNAVYGISDLSVDPEVLDRAQGSAVNNKSRQVWDHYVGQPHYRFGDIYQDELGHKWMVLLMSGSKGVNKTVVFGDSTCYAELISFDGLTPSADRGKITNLPTRDQVMRAAIILQNYHIFTLNGLLKNEPLSEAQYSHLGKTVLTQVEQCHFDARMLFQILRAQQEEHWRREPTFMGSFAYNDPTDNSGKQRLLRFIANYQNPKKEPDYYFWEHYVEKPDSVSEFYSSVAYNTDPIYLQDIALQDWVVKYGEDSYARMPIFLTDAWENGVTGDYRLPRGRNDMDAKANDVTNYYYDMSKWLKRTFPRDMWNAPVIMFRMTAVYDRGDMEYGTVTVDGHTLTPVSVREWTDTDGDSYWDTHLYPSYLIWLTVTNKTADAIWLDGKQFGWPDPFKTWQKEYR